MLVPAQTRLTGEGFWEAGLATSRDDSQRRNGVPHRLAYFSPFQGLVLVVQKQLAQEQSDVRLGGDFREPQGDVEHDSRRFDSDRVRQRPQGCVFFDPQTLAPRDEEVATRVADGGKIAEVRSRHFFS